jgi:hypothetical protein
MSAYPNGLYEGLLFPALRVLERRLTLFGWVRRLVRCLLKVPDDEPLTPPATAEVYQLIWLSVAVGVLVSGTTSWFTTVLMLVRAYDIFVFLLYWVLASDPGLTSLRRSLAGFIVNFLETVVISPSYSEQSRV